MDSIFQTASSGISISVTATASTAVLLPVTDFLDSIAQGAVQLRVVSEGPSIAFIAAGKASDIAATLPTGTTARTCDAVLPGSDVMFTLSPEARYISAICRSGGTATLSVYIGRGQ